MLKIRIPLKSKFIWAGFVLLLFILGCKQPYARVELEIKWAEALYLKYKSELKCRKGPEQRYLENMLTEFLQHVQHNPYKITVCITTRKEINAFAMPAGRIFINQGMLKAIRSEQELAFVMGHELSHVLLRHAFHRETKRKRAIRFLEGLKKNKLPTLGGYFFGKMGLLQYTRHNEKNADLKSLHFIQRTGYDPRGAVNFMEFLRDQRFIYRSRLLNLFSTHPSPKKRLRYLKRRVQRMVRSESYRPMSPEFKKLKRRYKQ